MKIQGSHFVVTGGNRGIGLAVAEMAAREKAHVYVCARSIEPDIPDRLRKMGAASFDFLKCDLSTKEGTEALANDLRKINVDLLFNNAGLLTGGLLEEQGLDEIYSMFQVNLNALVHLTRAVLPNMVRRGSGKVVNNASVSGFMHFPCASTYAASKAAVIAFTNCLEAELTGTGVTTLCLVTPGIKTRMFDEIEVKYGKNIEIPKESISPEQYAEKIKLAIESDQSALLPGGATRIGLWIARYLNPVFKSAVRGKLKRST